MKDKIKPGDVMVWDPKWMGLDVDRAVFGSRFVVSKPPGITRGSPLYMSNPEVYPLDKHSNKYSPPWRLHGLVKDEFLTRARKARHGG